MGIGRSKNKKKSPEQRSSSATPANSDDENKSGSDYTDGSDDSQGEQTEINEVQSNKRQASSRRSSQRSNGDRKRTSSSSQQPALPVENQSSLTPDSTVNTGQRNATLRNPKPHTFTSQKNSDSDDGNYKPKGNHNRIGEDPTTTAKFRTSMADQRKSVTSSRHSSIDVNRKSTTSSRRSSIDVNRKSTTSSRHSSIDVNRKTSTTSIRNTSQPNFCPHCRQSMPMTTAKKLEPPQPRWIVEAPPTTKRHIDMDQYDEETMRENIISKYHHLPGSYDYFPNIVIDEREDDNDISNNNVKQTTITRYGSSISPTHTPYPNYDLLRRHEHRLNKPFA